MNFSQFRKFLPLIVIIIAMALVFAFGLDEWLNWETLRQHESNLKQTVAQHPVLLGALFVLVYTLVVALSLPAATVLTLSGGLIFGPLWGGGLTIIGATSGACLVFLATRSAFGDFFRKKAGARLQQFQQGFQRDAVSYLLMVRFIPVFPFFLVNIAAALTGVSFITFALTTAFGIAPGTFIYASVGNGISVVLAQGQAPDLGIIFQPEIFLPLTGLGVLSLLPIFIRKIQQVKRLEEKKKKLIKTDICVIGAGSGGLSVAAGAVQMGARTVLIERDKMGGDCLNYGCVPSKALLAAADAAEQARQATKFGIQTGKIKPNYQQVQAHVADVIAEIEPHDSVERFEGLGVQVLKGAARFENANTVQVGTMRVRAKRFVIATGSKAAIPPIAGLKKVDYLTNETLFDMPEFPTHLLIIGGGAIGVEMAQAHARLGAKVTILERDRLLPQMDEDVVDILREKLQSEGVECLEGVKIKSVSQTQKLVKVTFSDTDSTHLLTGSHILVAAGRKPQIAGLQLDKAQIDYDAQGIRVDRRLRTSNKKIFAIGDVTGLAQLTHAAGYHAGIVIRNALFKLPARAQHEIMPQAVYTNPELASVGLTEQEARSQNIEHQILISEFSDNDRARAEKSTEGKIKLVLSRKGKILGATIIGKNAGDLLAVWTLALEQKLTIGAMASTIAPYPTRAEISKRAAGSYYTPSLFSQKTKRLVRLLNLFSS